MAGRAMISPYESSGMLHLSSSLHEMRFVIRISHYAQKELKRERAEVFEMPGVLQLLCP
jgi:hypothetical protein